MGVMLGVVIAINAPEPDVQQTIEWLDNPRSLENFSLEDDAVRFDNQSLKGQWTIVSFGFLNCPDICPTSLSQLAKLADRLAQKPMSEELAYVFVSVDPGRDSVTEIAQYVRHFDSSFRGVTGREEQLAALASNLGIQFKVTQNNNDYTVGHSITYSIIDPEGVFRGRFRPGFDLPDLVRGLTSKLVEASF